MTLKNFPTQILLVFKLVTQKLLGLKVSFGLNFCEMSFKHFYTIDNGQCTLFACKISPKFRVTESFTVNKAKTSYHKRPNKLLPTFQKGLYIGTHT